MVAHACNPGILGAETVEGLKFKTRLVYRASTRPIYIRDSVSKIKTKNEKLPLDFKSRSIF